MLAACGSNGRGQLGLGHTEDMDDWTEVGLKLCGPISMAGGGNHTVIVERDTGRSYISDNARFTPVEHPNGFKWKLCSAGWAFTVLVDEKNSVWVFGWGSKGELGMGDISTSELANISWEPPSEIISVKSGMSHTVVCLADGTLWGWGASRKGQLNREQAVLNRPVPVISNVTPQTHACGRDFTVVLLEGKLKILGNSRWFESCEIEARNEDSVLAGWSSVLLLPSGRALGNNSHNQLCAPSKLDAVALGSEHGVYRVGNSIRTWGWGEHGNCPPDREFDRESIVFAGCATSFVYCSPPS